MRRGLEFSGTFICGKVSLSFARVLQARFCVMLFTGRWMPSSTSLQERTGGFHI